MAVTAVIGTGLSFTFAGTTTMAILSVDGPNLTRASIEASKMGTTGGYHEFLPGSLVDPGEITVEFEYTGDLPLAAMTAAASTLTVTYSNAEVITGAAFMTGFSPSAPLEDKMTATGTFKFTGTIA